MKDLKDMSAREIFSMIMLVAVGVGLWDTVLSGVELLRLKIAMRKNRKKLNNLLAYIQDRVDNHGFLDGLNEEQLQDLRELGIKF